MVPILLALVLTSSVARGGGIVLESYTGERPADAPRLLAPILEELSRRDYAAGDTIARSYESQVSRSAVAPGGLPADFGAQVDRGFKAWVGGKFDEAIKVLVPLVETAQANTGAFAKEPALLDPLRKALIALALSYQRNGDPSAMRNTFAEILRIWPDAQISRATYGPDAQTAFDQVKHDVQAAGRGKLTVKTDDAGVVFIDETYRAAGSTTVELVPGEYRVVVMLGKQPSRNHRVTVRANAETTVEIDPRLDQSVRTAGFTGLSFGNQGDRDKNEAAYAQRFARAIGASAVAVVGIDDVHGRSAVIGSLVSLQTGREIRRASIPVEPDPSTDKLRALARFLAGDDPAPGLEVQFSGPTAAAAANPNGAVGEVHTTPEGGAAHAGWWGGWRYVTAGLAVGGIGAGVAFLAIDGGCKDTPPPGQQCRKFYEFSAAAYGSLAGGAVMAGLSIYLFATYHKTPVVQPTQGGATIGFATRF
jgi:hypothetical protein